MDTPVNRSRTESVWRRIGLARALRPSTLWSRLQDGYGRLMRPASTVHHTVPVLPTKHGRRPQVLHSVRGRIRSRSRPFGLEVMEPRLLLSADVSALGVLQVGGTEADDEVVLSQTVDGLKVYIGGSLAGSFGSGTYQGIEIDALGGQDTIRFEGDIDLDGHALSAMGEEIAVAGSIKGASSVNLTARSDTLATITVQGDIEASGAVVLSAQSGATDAITGFSSHDATSIATVGITGAGTTVQGQTVVITAHNRAVVTAVFDAGDFTQSTLSITQNNTTAVSVGDGVTLDGAGGVMVESLDDSWIQIELDSTGIDVSGGIELELDFALLSSQVVLTRSTTVTLEEGSTVESDVLATVSARNDLAPRTGVATQDLFSVSNRVLGGLVGQASNTVTDVAEASVSGATVNAALSVLASNAGVYAALGRVASNTLDGNTLATVRAESNVTAAGSVSVAAIDSAHLTAEATPVLLDAQLVVGNIDLQAGVARNAVAREVTASIDSSVVRATNGDITLDADAARQLRAVAAGVELSDDNLLDGAVFGAVALGGVYAENRVLGDVTASAAHSELETVGSGEVRVEAADTSLLDAQAGLSGVATTAGIGFVAGGISAGVAVAFNAMGWNIDADEQTLETLIGTSFGAAAEDALDVKASLVNTRVNAAGNVTVQADAGARLDATVSNTNNATGAGLFGALSAAASGILTSNFVSGSAQALVTNTDPTDDTVDITVLGSFTVRASDTTLVAANTRLVSSAVSTSDGGANVLNDVLASLEHDHTSLDGSVLLAFGDRVLVDEGHTAGGEGDRAYQYMGASGTLDLGQEDYSNADWWKEILETQLIPEGYNLANSSSVAIGGLVVRNDLRTEVLALLDQVVAQITDGDMAVTALQAATISSVADAEATASGGSAYGTGTVIAASGLIATNMVRSQADARVSNSRLTLQKSLAGPAGTGQLTIDARNLSSINASVHNAVISGDTGVGVTLAFNTLGWEAQNLLYQTVDALVSTDIAQEDKAGARAELLNTVVTTHGAVTVSAEMAALIDATVDNQATSTASAIYGATGLSVSALLASNMVSTETVATVGDPSDATLGSTITAGGAIEVLATESSSVKSGAEMLAKGSTSNDGGASLINNLARALLNEYRYTSRSGLQTLNPDDMVRVASDSTQGVPGALYAYQGTSPMPINLGQENFRSGDWLRVDERNIVPALGNVSNSDSIAIGGLVVRNDVRGGVGATVADSKLTGSSIGIQALGQAVIAASTLSAAEASGGSLYGSGTVIAGNGSAVTNLVLGGADALALRSELTSTLGDVMVTAENTAQIDATLLSKTSSGDTAVGVMLAFNSVGWTSQNLLMNALDALIGRPVDSHDASRTEVGVLEQGTRVLAANGNVYEYLGPTVSGQTLGETFYSTAPTSWSQVAAGQQVETFDVRAADVGKLKTGDRVLADDGKVYRYLGATTTITALADGFQANQAQWTEVVSPYGNEQPAATRAQLLDTLVNSAGDVIVSAVGEAQINATVSNAASSAASALVNATGKSIGGILASNKVSSAAEASIGFTSGFVHPADADVQAEGRVDVTALDNAGIYANTRLVSDSVTVNDGGVGLLSGEIDARLPVDHMSDDPAAPLVFGDRVQLIDGYGGEDFVSEDGEQAVATGQRVLVSADHTASQFSSDNGVRLLRYADVVQLADDHNDPSRGDAGATYRFIAPGTRGQRTDLQTEDYTDTSRWVRIGGDADTLYEYLGSDATFDLALQDFTDESLWRVISGSGGDVYQYMGQASTVNLTLADFGDDTLWKLVPESQVIPTGLSITSSDSVGVGGVVVLNDVRSTVLAQVSGAEVSAASDDDTQAAIAVTASVAAVIRADTDAALSSSGGNVFGEGTSLALGGVLATNRGAQRCRCAGQQQRSGDHGHDRWRHRRVRRKPVSDRRAHQRGGHLRCPDSGLPAGFQHRRLGSPEPALQHPGRFAGHVALCGRAGRARQCHPAGHPGARQRRCPADRRQRRADLCAGDQRRDLLPQCLLRRGRPERQRHPVEQPGQQQRHRAHRLHKRLHPPGAG